MKKIIFLLFFVWLSSCSDKELEQFDKALYDDSQDEANTMICPVEIMPEFVGGTEALFQYLKQNNQFSPKNVCVEGKVFVSFIITEKGKITDVELLKGIYEPCDKEAIRMIENMPDWIPARQMGRVVRSKMIIPVNFSMNYD